MSASPPTSDVWLRRSELTLRPIRTFCTAEEFSVVGRHEIDHRPADLCEQQRS